MTPLEALGILVARASDKGHNYYGWPTNQEAEGVLKAAITAANFEQPWAELRSNGAQIYWATSEPLDRLPLGRYYFDGEAA